MWPPQGWRFRQPETGWSAPGGQTFGQVVEAIISHRQQNPRFKLSTDRATVENELDDYTCAILKNDQHWCVGSAVASFSAPLPAFPRLAEARRSAAGGSLGKFVENAVVGIKSWIEFFGDGKPVDRTLAEKRASVCVSCLFNESVNLAQKFTSSVVKEIMGIFEVMIDLNLETSKDAQLKVCKICDCPTRAKVHVPLAIIQKQMKPETVVELPDHCWIKKLDKI